ncbi:putative lipoate-protein ligase [Trypanosoma cruzi]|uniref:Lipoate-protein ligase, putative n=2 Tax=Trypanosoma cruzi TaxID=5693 RepID=Q4DK96_TRYCC|nr:lipoate-protein ligase, putative [Trypanosoma cruzi]EAN92947.1 lipoate-protein ligase, putative [Trypanosoma cruzi]PWV01217.1 putative lipoate-protein ligase [Trypanosoma cruzi]|eukprot:XP_814798.1 lipoate-protein ligase [Trypanosoma cruzi strain CL Brener]
MMRRMGWCLCPTTTLFSFLTRHATATHSERQLTEARASVALVSNSRCIFENLAVEEALLRGVILPPGQQLLFSYVNRPCVVIGRNQNYLQEVAVSAARRDGVPIARRSSGGGAVYHDTGNVCFSFFTHRSAYHPERTIEIIRLFLCCAFDICPERLTTTFRHDLFLDRKKITGSAMRVQRDIACHHCTLLVKSCSERLSAYLQPEGQYVFFTTSSIGSVRSSVTTLQMAGVLPEGYCSDENINGEDVVHCTQRSLADFFVRHVGVITAHSAPWEIDPSIFLSKRNEETKGSEEKTLHPSNESVFLLDVVGALRENTRIVDGEGRRPAAGSSKTVLEEVDRLRSADWMFSMPKFTTCVAVTAKDLLAWENDTIVRSCVPPGVVTYLMQGRTRFDITTVVECRHITKLTACWAENAAGDVDEMWCAAILRVLLEGVRVDDPTVDVSEENAVLVAALQLECRSLMDGMPLSAREENIACDENGSGSLDEQSALLLFMRAVLSVWRVKNVFIPVISQ